MKSSVDKLKTSSRAKRINDKHWSRDKISRAMKRFVHSDKEKLAHSGDSKTDSYYENFPESEENESESAKDGESKKSEEQQKKRIKKRASVAILVGKFESEVRAVRSKVSRTRILKSDRGSFDNCVNSRKGKLTSKSLPPAPANPSSSSTSSHEEDREVENILSSSYCNQGSEEELFVPRGFNSNRLLVRKQAQRRKDYRGLTKSDNDLPNTTRLQPDSIATSRQSSDITDTNSRVLPKAKHKLKAGDMASILKNRKTDNRSSENVSEAETKKISSDITAGSSRPRIPVRQRSQSEKGPSSDSSAIRIEKLTSTTSAPSAAFFLNNGSPLSSASQPNLSKVLEGATKEEYQSKGEVYENKEYRDRVSRAATPPLHRQFEEPLQGFHVVKPSSFPPREVTSAPPRSALIPKARTPVSSQLQERLSSVETLLCDIVTRLDNLDCCSRGFSRRQVSKQTRTKNKISLKIRMSREQTIIKRRLSVIDKRTSLMAKKVDRLSYYSHAIRRAEVPRELDEILKLLKIERSVNTGKRKKERRKI